MPPKKVGALLYLRDAVRRLKSPPPTLLRAATADEMDRGFKLALARAAIADLRTGAPMTYERSMQIVEDALDDGITADKLGTNKRELDGFPRLHVRACARLVVRRVRESSQLHANELAVIAQAVRASIPPEEFGLSRKELRNLPWRYWIHILKLSAPLEDTWDFTELVHIVLAAEKLGLKTGLARDERDSFVRPFVEA